MLWLILILFSLMVGAESAVDNLQQVLLDLERQSMAVMPPALPAVLFLGSNYTPTRANDVFELSRATAYTSAAVHDFNLSLLQMVGYLRYGAVDFAFIKTPFETLKLKLGDRIQQGTISKILSTGVQIDEQQVVDNKNYTNRIYIELKADKLNFPKLQAQ